MMPRPADAQMPWTFPTFGIITRVLFDPFDLHESLEADDL
jgi:hypothetical protein